MTPPDDADADASSEHRAADGWDGAPEALIERARTASERAVAPYSGYRVGAAIAAGDAVYVGCNLEVGNYSNSLHAEEVALGTALADAADSVDALAVSTAARDGATPCGACRQTLWEFCPPDLPVYCDEGEDVATYELEALLPAAFAFDPPESETRD